MFKDLFERMKKLAVASQSKGLFSAFQDDLYKHDLDIVTNDLQCGETWLWVIKEYGTYLTLVCPGNEYLQALLDTVKRDGMKRRYFIISVMQDRCDIKEVPVLDLHDVVKSQPYIKNRVPNRQFASSLLYGAFPSVKGTIMMANHSLEKGAELFLSVAANSLTYVTTASNKSGTIGLPFDANRASGYLKLTVTTEFGHGELVPITAKVFNNAVKKVIKRAA